LDTLGFFQAILPESGPYYLVLFQDGRNGPAHQSFTTLEAMAQAAVAYSQKPNLAVYHACASYLEPYVEVDGKKKYRIERNWGQAKSLWIDVDCGADKAQKGEGYATKSEAAAALAAFCQTTALPPPIIVDSGGGLHCYWPFTESVSAYEWKEVAGVFKSLLAAQGFLADPTATADFARILRPVGSYNRKREAREVRARHVVEPYEFTALRSAIFQAASDVGVELPEIQLGPVPEGLAGLNDDLTAHTYVKIPSSAEQIAEQCAQVRHVRDTLGDGSREHWRGVIGILAHCTEGVELAIKWTEKRLTYGKTDNDAEKRFNTWSTGPTTCDFFNKNNPTLCMGCPHQGKIKSPIVLGRSMPEPVNQVVEALTTAGEKSEIEIPPLPPTYQWDNGLMVRLLKDKDGYLQPFPFSHTLFYPIYRVHKENGEYSMGLRMHLPDKRVREFDVDTGLLASPTKLLEELGHRGEIVQTNHKDSALHMTAYLRDALERLKAEAEEMNTMISFGWKYDMQAFLIGDRLYHKDGTKRRVLVGGYAADYRDHFPEPKGTVDGYAKAVDHVYNRGGMEPLQYALCSAFGSVLTPFGENMYRGLLVAITGGESGRGKSTVCHAALYAFGDAKKMTIATEKGATNNFQYAQLGTYGSIPMLFDEYTNIEPEEFSQFAYRISQGEEKGRLTTAKGGVRKGAQASWSLSPYVTANKDLHAILASHTANSQAEAVRMIQIKIDEYTIPQLAEGEVDSALTQMRVNSGRAGEAFIEWVVGHIDDTFELFQKTISEVAKHIPGPKYRYYRNHAAATLTAAEIAKNLGIFNFDNSKLFDFTVSLMRKLCEAVVETNTVTAEDALNQMLTELGPRILATVEYRDARDARGPEPTARINQAIAGRYIVGGAGSKDSLGGRLYLVRKEMKDWCMKHRLELSAVLQYAKDVGILIHENERFTLTRGTNYANANLKCVVLDMNKLAGAVSHSPKLVVHSRPEGVASSEQVG
jgi:uncharacterized protein (DUF927 family)